jgi:hypothetical protein
MRDNDCIRKAWQDWYDAYLAAPDGVVDAPNRNNINVPNVYVIRFLNRYISRI